MKIYLKANMERDVNIEEISVSAPEFPVNLEKEKEVWIALEDKRGAGRFKKHAYRLPFFFRHMSAAEAKLLGTQLIYHAEHLERQ